MAQRFRASERNWRHNLKESELKQACEDYLQIQQNAGKLLYLRLNSGNLVVTNPDGSYRRRIRGCPKGTSDYIVIEAYDPDKPSCLVYFLELKSSKGKTTEAQDKFAELVREQGAEYFVIRSIERLTEVLK